MTKRSKFFAGVLAVAFFGVSLVAIRAYAGLNQTSAYNCQYITFPNDFECFGAMNGYRTAPSDSTANAAFQELVVENGTISKEFYATVGGTFRYCIPPAAMEPLWSDAMATHAYFRITFNPSTHVCKTLELANQSSYGNAW